MELAKRGKTPWLKPLAIAGGVFLVYLLLGFLAAPPLVERVLVNFIGEELQRKASIGEVRVNPLSLTLEVKDFLTEKDGAPLFAFKRLHADFRLSSLFRAAWTFADLSLEGLDLRADIAPDGRFNIAALLDSLPKSTPQPDAKPPRALIQRLTLAGGSVAFSDRSISTPASVTIAPIDIQVLALSTIPDRNGNHTLTARLPEGGSLTLKGEASLQPLASRGELEIKGARLPTLWKFLRDRVPLAEPQGELDLALRYEFAYAAGATQLALEQFSASVRGLMLATTGEKNVSAGFSELAVSGGRTELSMTRGKPWQAKLASLKVALTDLLFTDRTRATPFRAAVKETTIALAASAEERDGRVQAVLEGVTIAQKGLSAGPANAAVPMGELASIAVEGLRLEIGADDLAIGRVAVAGGELRVTREKDGSIPILKVLAPAEGGVPRKDLAVVVKEGRAEVRPWRVRLDELDVRDLRVAVVDHAFGAPIVYGVQDLRVQAQGIDTADKAPLRFEAGLRLQQGGSMSAHGEARISGEQAELRAKVERVNLAPLQPALATRARVKLKSGNASADVKLSYRKRGDKHGLRLGGTARVDNLLVNEADSGDRLLAWKSFTASGLSLQLEPNQMRVEEARLEGLGAKVVVYKDRSTNLSKALVLEQIDDKGRKATVATGDTEAAFPVAVERLRIEDGSGEFADLSLVLPFATRVHKVAGIVQGVTTDRQGRATLKLEGDVDEYGLMRAEGSVKPFHPTEHMDITLLFRNVDMPPLSPYSATFAGRRIASGKLSLDLKYKIDQGKLAGDNRMLLEKFTLGERVEAPSALDLPLDLAVALLTDGDGRIDLSVPVAGDVNDPKFDYGAVVWQAVKIILTNIVTAPFRALAALFGGGSENLESIAFDPGRSAVLPPEQEKLKRVSEALAKRPQLKVVAEGQTGPADRSALQQRDVALAVSTKLGREVAPGAAPDPVDLTDAKTQRALEQLFVERSSEDALARFAADTGKARGKEVDRVNADRAFYDALLKRLNETARVPDAAFAQLAEERSKAVAAVLTTKFAVPAERASARSAKSTGAAQARLELEVAK